MKWDVFFAALATLAGVSDSMVPHWDCAFTAPYSTERVNGVSWRNWCSEVSMLLLYRLDGGQKAHLSWSLWFGVLGVVWNCWFAFIVIIEGANLIKPSLSRMSGSCYTPNSEERNTRLCYNKKPEIYRKLSPILGFLLFLHCDFISETV